VPVQIWIARISPLEVKLRRVSTIVKAMGMEIALKWMEIKTERFVKVKSKLKILASQKDHMKVTVDRKEGDFFVMVPATGEKFNLPVSQYPNLKEGDVLDISESEISSATEETKARINNARKGLNKRYWPPLELKMVV